MRITLEVGGAAETDDLRQWLRRNPELRGAVGGHCPGRPCRAA